VVCSTNAEISCERICGNVLECGNHSCKKKCHIVSHIREIIQTDTGLQEVVTFAPPDAEIEFVDGEEQETVQLEDDTCEECSLVCQKERNPPCK
jgi:hypothetical protein